MKHQSKQWRALCNSLVTLCLASALIPSTTYARSSGPQARLAKPAAGESPTDQLAGRLTLEDLAICAVYREPNKALRIVNTAAATQESWDLIDSFFATYDECLSSGGIKFPADLVRGYFFRALYLRYYRKTGPTDFSTVQTRYRELYGPEMTQPEMVDFAFQEFAECVVKANPTVARKLQLSRAGSQSEIEAFSGLGPQLSACLTIASEIKFSKAKLKGVLAEALYRYSKAAQPDGQR